jgi:hypothetical protein
MFAASAMAANNLCWSACAAAAPLSTHYVFDALGVGEGGSLIGGVAVLLAPIPFVFYNYGEEIRRRSKFAPMSMVPERLEDKDRQGEMLRIDVLISNSLGVDHVNRMFDVAQLYLCQNDCRRVFVFNTPK